MPRNSREKHSATPFKTKGTILSSVAKGRLYENRVCSVLKNKKFKVLKRNFRTPYAEVDLLFLTPSGKVVMIEVKKSTRAGVYLSTRQAQRLERARQYLSAHYGHQVRCHLAIVDSNKNVTFIEDILAHQLC